MDKVAHPHHQGICRQLDMPTLVIGAAALVDTQRAARHDRAQRAERHVRRGQRSELVLVPSVAVLGLPRAARPRAQRIAIFDLLGHLLRRGGEQSQPLESYLLPRLQAR